MNITGMVHININCRDYSRSKAFYEMLGFVEVWKVPATNDAQVNAAVGTARELSAHAAVHSFT